MLCVHRNSAHGFYICSKLIELVLLVKIWPIEEDGWVVSSISYGPVHLSWLLISHLSGTHYLVSKSSVDPK